MVGHGPRANTSCIVLLLTKKVMDSPMSVGLLVCQQDYTETTLLISMKLGWRMGLSPE